jgi:phosphoribosylcarboxyaminoimidazole (NCAIR) mutase
MKHLRILLLAGSVNDLEQNDQPTKLVEELFLASEKLTEGADFKIDLRLAACSADRTPFLLPSVLNEEPFDGVIYTGGYSLVLGAALHEAIFRLRFEERIHGYEGEFLDFLDHSKRDIEYLPGKWRHDLVKSERSWLYGSQAWIPCIGVPLKDKASGGLSAFLSIVETPGLCDPRPVVGPGRSDTALRALVQILLRDENFSPVLVYDVDCDEAESLAHKLRDLLKSMGFLDLKLRQEPPRSGTVLAVYIGEAATGLLSASEKQVALLINLPVSRYEFSSWSELFSVYENLDNTITMGVGAFENCALLLARMMGGTVIKQNFWKLKYNKTEKSMRK